MPRYPLILATLAGLFFLPAAASAQSFDAWLAKFKQSARQQGISEQTLESAFAGVMPNERVITLDGKQPEKKIGFDEYFTKTVTTGRVAQGQQLLRDNWDILSRVERQYGVQAQYIVALWGIETSYGRNTGGFDLVQALATLAWEGRRGEYFSGELLKALKILQGGHVPRQDFKGSWAGAMGQIQFMPSSWFNFAVDYDGDGHKDIWTDRADIFASAANYLARSKWQPEQRWGREVSLPQGFDRGYINADTRMGLSAWAKLGVKDASGAELPQDTAISAALIRPDGAGEKAYLVYGNFQTIMSWNRSKYFALSVGMLADRIAQARPSSVFKSSTTEPHFNE